MTVKLYEYILVGDFDECFDLHQSKWAEALCPAGIEYYQPIGFGQDHLTLHVGEINVTFSPEPPGWQVSIDKAPSEEQAYLLVEAIHKNIESVSGQKGKIVPLGNSPIRYHYH